MRFLHPHEFAGNPEKQGGAVCSPCRIVRRYVSDVYFLRFHLKHVGPLRIICSDNNMLRHRHSPSVHPIWPLLQWTIVRQKPLGNSKK